jgi:hypothetical protein
MKNNERAYVYNAHHAQLEGAHAMNVYMCYAAVTHNR